MLPIPPISQQASSQARNYLISEIRKITTPVKYVLIGEVQLEIQWSVHERLRWETDISPDVDNILKPLIDGLSGPEGLLIDDCQIQSVTSSWIDWDSEDQQLDIRLRFVPDSFLYKYGLSFVRIKDALCFPIPNEIREKSLQAWLDVIEKEINFRDEIVKITKSYYPARYVLPEYFFHRTRIRGFPVHDLSELRKLGN